MRVDYTLPALLPEAIAETPEGVASPVTSFRDQIRGAAVLLPVSWEQQLRLDAPPFTGTYIGPPPRPRTLEINDADSTRSRWRNMVDRHSISSQAMKDPEPGKSTHDPVRAMLSMLQEMQQTEDAIMSQSASLTRG